jgi:hypothetical protein
MPFIIVPPPPTFIHTSTGAITLMATRKIVEKASNINLKKEVYH